MSKPRIVQRRVQWEKKKNVETSHWHAVYTRPRAEKKVRDRLRRSGVRVYLPLMSQERKWSDRVKVVKVPLFRGYVFVCVDERDAVQTLRTPGVARIITFEGKRAKIPQSQIEAIRRILERGGGAKVVTHLVEGERVRVQSGALKGLEGTCMEDGDRQHIQVQIEAIGQVMRVVISPHDLESID